MAAAIHVALTWPICTPGISENFPTPSLQPTEAITGTGAGEFEVFINSTGPGCTHASGGQGAPQPQIGNSLSHGEGWSHGRI